MVGRARRFRLDGRVIFRYSIGVGLRFVRFPPMSAIRRLYAWTLSLAGHRHAVCWLAVVAFIESSVFPIPPDALLIPMVLARRERAFLYAFVATVASVFGGLAGYGIGYFLFDALGRPLADLYGAGDALERVRGGFAQYGWWIVLGGGMTPFPYKAVAIAAGALGLNPAAFVAASVVGRGGRFVLVATLLWKLGAPVRARIEKHLGLVVTSAFILLIGGFFAIGILP